VVRVPDPDDEPYDPPALGTEVVHERLATVGPVVDVFGPVGPPVPAVTAAGGEPAGLLGRVVYGR